MKANKRVLSDRNNVTRNSHKPYPSKPFPGNDLLRNLDTIHFVSIDNMKFCSLEIWSFVRWNNIFYGSEFLKQKIMLSCQNVGTNYE